jgi:hypothetical protein
MVMICTAKHFLANFWQCWFPVFDSQMTLWSDLMHFLGDKLFDIALALFGTWLGYFLARRHLEHFVSELVKKMDAKYLDLNRQIAFHKAVGAMVQELPNFHIRSTGFSSHVATAVSEFTRWSATIDPTHTPEKSMELVGKEAYTLAADMVAKDLGFREEEPEPNFEWVVGVEGLPAAGWKVEEAPDLSIYDWNTGIPVQRYALMQETARTDTSILYSWKWSTKDVPCGVYVGVTNYKIGGTPVFGCTVQDRVKVFYKRENGKIIKSNEIIPWN